MLKNRISGSLKRYGKCILHRDKISCLWSKSDNWGDALNPYLVEKISHKAVRYDENPVCWKYLVIGSIVERADAYSTIWGSGLIGADVLPKEAPYAICALRGPHSRAKLMAAGIDCPQTYGDPALLLPRYFNPKREVKWGVGVIPHYTDQSHPWVKSIREEEGVNVINIYLGIEEFVEQVLSCESILSSSLHGLICADSYGIPNRRMVLYDDARIGGSFKFTDYYGGINIKVPDPIYPKYSQSASDFIPGIPESRIDVDLDKLFNACPFR